MVKFVKPSLNRGLAGRLAASRGADGGFGPRVGAPPEPEATALAAIALDDEDARTWLAARQREDGSLALELGGVDNDAATALAAIAFGPGEPRERALDYLAGAMAAAVDVAPVNPAFPGWPWTRDTAGWVEPTARTLLAFRLFRAQATNSIAIGLGLLRDRECVTGGWNYGSRSVYGLSLPPFGQTTAIALVGIQRADLALAERGLQALRHLWREERDGGLTLATSVAALGLLDDVDHGPAMSAMIENFTRTDFLGDVVALAWGTIATGPGLERLRVLS